MQANAQAHACCCKCGGRHIVDAYTSINVSESPEMKEKVMSGEIFIWECPDCGTRNLVKYPILYHDPSENLMLVMTDALLDAKNLPEGYTGRLVRNVGDLIEKIKIFDAGLDDVVIELCKFVTAREFGGNPELKFFRLDGADGEITFSYPDDGEMQMLAVGLNVYEDCRGIASRNPSLKEAAEGLVTVDRRWLEEFMS